MHRVHQEDGDGWVENQVRPDALVEDEGQVVHHVLKLVRGEEAGGDADDVADHQEDVGRVARERFFGPLLLAHERDVNLPGLFVRVPLEVFAQPRGQVPDADDEERDHDRAPDDADLPELRLQHGDDEGREEECDSGEDGLRPLGIGPAIGFEQDVNHAVAARLRRDHAHPAGVYVVGVHDEAAAPLLALLLALGVVGGPLLRVAQRAVSQGEQGEFARRVLGPAVDIRVALARQTAVGRLDLGGIRGPLDT